MGIDGQLSIYRLLRKDQRNEKNRDEFKPLRLAGLGYLNMDPLNTVAFNVGVGQNFFFTKSFGLRADLRLMIFSGTRRDVATAHA